MNGIIGKKVGMTSIFDDLGRMVAVTVIHVEPNIVTQVKTKETDKYNALQLSAGQAKEKNVSKPLMGHFANAKAGALKKTIEFKNSSLDKNLGDKVSIEDLFSIGDKVSATGVSKGKGFQGVVKRHGFAGVGDATHGQHNRLRAPGSVGASSYPSKVFKGMRMAGRTGGQKIKIKNLKVIKILTEKDLLLISGSIPGHNGSFVIIEK